ncbi:hypothetical protein [Nocardia huaxiensis]|uniref:Uncharacterized protein n=1 Tax=Nocardia huaxiensis TaxID=2755382 RepID=A0A7D6VDX1_9NOCA|nr:hypothetical protein [Nocardia huaxiensis]QLY30557.1 hypothetical protein H0264_36525 [Nocardia huaxiensis]UFS95841.1 hypothetical protein LPY97_35150 [Nocardia huaxiensis]
MALFITPWSITSDVTPEICTCAPVSGDFWVSSWLSDRILTLDQAISAMTLDEILSDPDPVDGDTALELAGFRAAELGLTLAEVVVRLAVRVAQRDEYLAHRPSGISRTGRSRVFTHTCGATADRRLSAVEPDRDCHC